MFIAHMSDRQAAEEEIVAETWSPQAAYEYDIKKKTVEPKKGPLRIL